MIDFNVSNINEWCIIFNTTFVMNEYGLILVQHFEFWNIQYWYHRHYPYKSMISKNWNFMQHGKNQGLSDQIFRRYRFKKGPAACCSI